jgi:hypothetical protein
MREVMDLVAVRLQAGETEEAFSVLSQVTSSADSFFDRTTSSVYSRWKFSDNASAFKQAVQLISLLCAALDNGPAPAASKAALERFAKGVMDRLIVSITYVGGSQLPSFPKAIDGVPDEDMVTRLAAAAAAVSSEAFDKYLVALVSALSINRMRRSLALELCLAAVKAARPPTLQQRLMEAVMSNVIQGRLSASLERDAFGVLASALCGGSPHLPAPLVDPLLGPFAAALLAHEGCPSILREVLQKEAVQAMACDESIAALVRKRIGQLERWTAHGPPGSWEQPGAWLPELPDIQAFLRGPEKELKVGQRGAAAMHQSPC